MEKAFWNSIEMEYIDWIFLYGNACWNVVENEM